MVNLFLLFSIVKLILSSFQWYITWTYSIFVNTTNIIQSMRLTFHEFCHAADFFSNDSSLTFNRILGQNGHDLKICMSTKKRVRNSKALSLFLILSFFYIFLQLLILFSGNIRFSNYCLEIKTFSWFEICSFWKSTCFLLGI